MAFACFRSSNQPGGWAGAAATGWRLVSRVVMLEGRILEGKRNDEGCKVVIQLRKKLSNADFGGDQCDQPTAASQPSINSSIGNLADSAPAPKGVETQKPAAKAPLAYHPTRLNKLQL